MIDDVKKKEEEKVSVFLLGMIHKRLIGIIRSIRFPMMICFLFVRYRSAICPKSISNEISISYHIIIDIIF